MRLTSSAFPDEGPIPDKYTSDGADVSPPLAIDGVPEGARSLVLIVGDPDAPHGDFAHWVIVDLPPTTRELVEGVAKLPGGRFGVNDFERTGWSGPAPPAGRHHYRFTLYALDRELGLVLPTKQEVESVIDGHIVAETTLVGTYQRAA